jgi:YidC/Oxa1 family membrane protein insertase
MQNMEFPRLLLLAALFLVAFMLWNAWENDYARKPTPPTVATTATASSVPAIAQTALANATATPPSTPPTAATKTATNTAAAHLIHVQTDTLSVTIDVQGGNIVAANLLKYPQQVDQTPSQPFQLLNNDPATLYVAQSGLISKAGPDTPKGQAIYTTAQSSYTLAPDQKQLLVNLKWKSPNGVMVNKQFIFKRGDYQIGMSYQISNNSKTAWTGQLYTQLQRKKIKPQSHLMFGINPYMGAAISSPNKPYQKLSFDKLAEQNLSMQIQGGWLAMQEHYFLSAWIPDAAQNFNYYSQVSDGDVYTIGALSPALNVQPGETVTSSVKLYTGPEILDTLKTVAPNLDLTVDYGILWFISIAILWLMKHIYSIVGNWGWSIVLVTVLIKLAFYHLSAKSYRSMAMMRKLQPRMQALRERYADDKQKMTQATMELYRNEKINPLGGCLPIIVQIPVFIALYFVLLESVELRQAPFILWIHDLSLHDPYYVLPVLMGISMFIQQKLNPPPPDPTQAKMMMFLPVFFTFLFSSFPAGLVLYWLVNNTVSILQQWYIMKKIDAAPDINKKKR